MDTIVHHLQQQLERYLAELTHLSGIDSYSYDRADVNRVVDELESRFKALNFEVTRYPHEKAGDNLLAVSAELRLPITSPLNANYHATQVNNAIYLPAIQNFDPANVWLSPGMQGG